MGESINIRGKENLIFKADDLEKQTFIVEIDGDTKGIGFRYDVTDSEWFDVIVDTNNKFIVSVKENFDIENRIGYITIHHNDIQGDNGEKIIKVEQEGVKCDVNVDYEDVSFDSFPFNVISEEKIIKVTVTGGNKKYFIKSFREFDTNNNVIVNDNGIKIIKVDDSTLKIISYGRIFMEDGCYYEITLAHDNDVSKICKIKVIYIDKNIDISNSLKDNSIYPIKKDNSNHKPLKKIRTNIELMDEYYNNRPNPYIELASYDESKRKINESKSLNKNEIIFEKDGGSKSFKINTYPKGTPISVNINSDFISYKINNEILTLIVSNNPYKDSRKCIIKIRNSSNQSEVITKTIIQKGIED